MWCFRVAGEQLDNCAPIGVTRTNQHLFPKQALARTYAQLSPSHLYVMLPLVTVPYSHGDDAPLSSLTRIFFPFPPRKSTDGGVPVDEIGH